MLIDVGISPPRDDEARLLVFGSTHAPQRLNQLHVGQKGAVFPLFHNFLGIVFTDLGDKRFQCLVVEVTAPLIPKNPTGGAFTLFF